MEDLGTACRCRPAVLGEPGQQFAPDRLALQEPVGGATRATGPLELVGGLLERGQEHRLGLR